MHFVEHCTQLVPESRYLPTGHEAHLDAPAKPYRPVEQLFPQPVVSLMAPLFMPYLPAGQSIRVDGLGQ